MKATSITTWALVALTISPAQSGDDYEITQSTIQASGGTASGSTYEVKGSVGQSEASSFVTGGIYVINGGIWSASSNNDIIFKNGFDN
ncbi:hypothetical protein OS175_02590 [Marinicella sp. S1101]|uniref:hypothetical protein n=1 Tax=Marinicella marina TaxID=2996016 RepID=UPI0022609D61|nr:hypothetical protein [Marinicella marina]MCX7552754.1 hypothetical protein [Marinicella marina]MDJ1139937.1 hypothetical protein [Marinicella marina]